ncbi:MAG: PEP-CTERM sorting domain-containing protein [Armatimonadetes bacterium]|nr:PEP-CTERM sorting domain-containing protein [Armatimonadota bacterium]
MARACVRNEIVDFRERFLGSRGTKSSFLTFALAFSVSVAHAAPPKYRAIELLDTTGELQRIQPSDISDTGVIVGGVTIQNKERLMVYNHGILQTLTGPKGLPYFGYATANNAATVSAVEYEVQYYNGVGYIVGGSFGVDPGGQPYELGQVGQYLYDINDQNQRVGLQNLTGVMEAVIHQNGQFTTLKAGPMLMNKAVAINNAGIIGGITMDTAGHSQALRWDSADSEPTVIDLPGYNSQVARIASNGTLVGVARHRTDADIADQLFIWRGNMLTHMDVGKSVRSQVEITGVNNAGYIVGNLSILGSGSDGVGFWDPAGNRYGLQDLIINQEGLNLGSDDYVGGMNEKGEMVARLTRKDRYRAIYLLQPVPEPASLALLSAGVAVILKQRRRQPTARL